MERKRALLLAIGGRIPPDIFAIQAVQPHLVIILTTEEAPNEEPILNFIQRLSEQTQILSTVRVKSYELDEIKQACTAVCQPYSQEEWDWTFSIGSCPKIMGIAAYEVAQQMHIPCIYMDARHDKIISLVKDIGITPQKFFHMNIKDYMHIYRREPKEDDGDKKSYRKKVENFKELTCSMALSPDTPAFLQVMRDKKAANPQILPAALIGSPLLTTLEQQGAIKITLGADKVTTCSFTNQHCATCFGTGDWLEIYVWHEVQKAEFADDCQWGYKIKSTAENELDDVLTYKAQLIMVECKTNQEPFSTKYLDGITSKASMLGGPYTTRVFVTSSSKNLQSYKNFHEQAMLRKILVVTAEDLVDIGSILKREAENPTYPRI